MRRRWLGAAAGLASLAWMGCGGAPEPIAVDPDAHAAFVDGWVERREAELSAPDSWLAIIGLHWLAEGETTERVMCRFRTLGCYPCTGAIRSTATTLPEIIQEMMVVRNSERITRIIDHDQEGSMEEKKKEGYF